MNVASKFYLKRNSNIGVCELLGILWIIQERLFCRRSTKGWFWNNSARDFFAEHHLGRNGGGGGGGGGELDLHYDQTSLQGQTTHC